MTSLDGSRQTTSCPAVTSDLLQLLQGLPGGCRHRCKDVPDAACSLWQLSPPHCCPACISELGAALQGLPGGCGHPWSRVRITGEWCASA